MSESGLLVIAIDGPAGAGKSTVSRMLTEALGYRLLDTGALYRCVALLAEERGIAWDDASGLAEIADNLEVRFELRGSVNHLYESGVDRTEAIREPAISKGASVVSAHPELRDALLGLQRRLADAGGVVAEGRDVGTVVLPNADVKFFLTASDEVRAQRRYDELSAKGLDVDLTSTLEEIRERDERDSQRDVAPMVQAEDAILVDSSHRSLEKVVADMLELVQKTAASIESARS